MRIKFAKFIAIFIILINVVVVYFTLKLFLSFSSLENQTAESKVQLTKSPTRHLSKLVTVIVRDFELYENDVTATVQSFSNIFPNVQILIVCDTFPYPPLELMFTNNKNVKIVNLSFNISKAFIEQYPLIHVKTKYVLFVPDSTRLPNRQSFQTLLTELTKQPESIIVAPIHDRNSLNCMNVILNIREWSVRYDIVKNFTCDAVTNKHVLMIETDVLKTLPNAFLLPFPQALYLQTAAQNLKVKILKDVTLLPGKPLLRSHHAQWKRQQIESERQKKLYTTFKFKHVTLETGLVEWYGCSRDTPRCFSSVVGSMPSYLFEGRWTPPCCLANLRRTAKHVFNCLDDAGVRYWLEAGSLVGAMRSGDVLPWDHDVDVGIYSDDVQRSLWLEKARNKPIIDSKGFLWEKATEGNFFRVHFSKINRIFVNIFPFYLKNGTMMKDSWYTSHKNMEFSDHFLHPMSSIEFLGRHVPSPNNIRDFLEFKYGKGVIEYPEYPDPNKLNFP